MGFAYYGNYHPARPAQAPQPAVDSTRGRDGAPVIEAHCEYRQPARYDDELLIRARGELGSPVRIRFTYEVVRTADGAVLAGVHTVHASTDLGGRPKRLPARVRALFA
jgi:acyl-CoA thioesterase FadM